MSLVVAFSFRIRHWAGLFLSQKREWRVKSYKGRFCIFNFYSEVWKLTSMFVCFSFRFLTNQTLVCWVDYLVLYKMEKIDPLKTSPIRDEKLSCLIYVLLEQHCSRLLVPQPWTVLFRNRPEQHCCWQQCRRVQHNTVHACWQLASGCAFLRVY